MTVNDATDLSPLAIADDATLASRNKILVLSHDPEVSRDVVKKIISAGDRNGDSTTQRRPTKKDADSNSSARRRDETDAAIIPWTIDTRYYTAKVDFWLDTCPVGGPEADVLESFSTIGNSIDAVIFLFEKNHPERLDDLQHWFPFIERHQPSITVCAGYHKNGEPDRSSEVYDTWCLENGFEFIDLERNEGAERFSERQGVDRVLETLQSHMWEGLKRKNDMGNVPSDETNRESEGDDEQFLNELLNIRVDGLPDPADAHHAEANQSSSIDEEFGDFVDSKSFENTHHRIFGSFDTDDDGFENAISVINELRDRSKSLPDAERRKVAAEVALSLAKQFGEVGLE